MDGLKGPVDETARQVSSVRTDLTAVKRGVDGLKGPVDETARQVSSVKQDVDDLERSVDGLEGPVGETARHVKEHLPAIRRELRDVKRGVEAERPSAAAGTPGVAQSLARIERELAALPGRMTRGWRGRDADGGTAEAMREVVETLERIERALEEMMPHVGGEGGRMPSRMPQGDHVAEPAAPAAPRG